MGTWNTRYMWRANPQIRQFGRFYSKSGWFDEFIRKQWWCLEIIWKWSDLDWVIPEIGDFSRRVYQICVIRNVTENIVSSLWRYQFEGDTADFLPGLRQVAEFIPEWAWYWECFLHFPSFNFGTGTVSSRRCCMIVTLSYDLIKKLPQSALWRKNINAPGAAATNVHL